MGEMLTLPSGIRLEYVRQGTGTGLPVVMLHGVTDSWRSFEAVLRHLPAARPAYALSLRGHGASSRPETGYRYADMAGDVHGFVDALGLGRVVVAGHSMGSMVAQQVAVERPETVAGLVLMGAFATIRGREDIAGFVRETILPLADPIDAGFAREWQVSTLARPVDAALLDTVVGETLKVPARVWHATFGGFLDTPDVLSHLTDRVQVPVLLAWGDRDTYALRGDQDRLLAALPQARLRVYEGGGHAFHWEDPAGFAAELEAFVGEVERGKH